MSFSDMFLHRRRFIMKQFFCVTALVAMFLFGCSASVTSTGSVEEDASTRADAPLDEQEASLPDSSPPDRSDTPPSDAPVPRLIASLNPASPPDRTIPPNATGIQAAFWDVTTPGESVPTNAMHVRHVGVGPLSDIANAYLFGVPRSSVARTLFRYSTGRAFDPITHEATFEDTGTIRDHTTVTWVLVVDFRNATPGAQHVFELVSMDTDQGTISFSAVRSHAITVGTELATRFDVQRGRDFGPVHANQRNAVIASMRFVNSGLHESAIWMFSLYQGGSAPLSRSVSNFQLWLGNNQIRIIEWMDPLNGYIALVPVVDLRMLANSDMEVTIRGDVHANPGETFFLYFEYPSDLQVEDRSLQAPAAVCISPTATGGCDMPSEGSLDGSSADNAILVPVIP